MAPKKPQGTVAIRDDVVVGGHYTTTPNPGLAPSLAGRKVTLKAPPHLEYVAGSSSLWYLDMPRSLSWAIDDVTRDFGSDLYARMMLDPQLQSVVNVLKAACLNREVELRPVIDDAGADGYEKAKQYVADAEGQFEELETSIDDVLWDMMDALPYGNRAAELVFDQQRTYTGKTQYQLTRMVPKPFDCVAYIVDAYNRTLALAGRVPGSPFPPMPSVQYLDLKSYPNILPRSKFAIYSFRPKNNDPRGMALDPETPIPTPDGWRTMDDLQPGDKVFDEKGKMRYVMARKDWDDRPCYRVSFRDGSEIIADENHLWPVENQWYRSQGRVGLRTTKELSTRVRDKRGNCRYTVPAAEPLDYPEQAQLLEPYFLGLWLGDGSSNTASIAYDLQDEEETIQLLRAVGYDMSPVRPSPLEQTHRGRHLHVRDDVRWSPTAPERILRAMGLCKNKHVPPAYLRGSVEQRRALLAGLMDSDGHIDKDGRCEFSNTNKNLVEGVGELVRSLGSTAHVHLRRRGFVGPDGSVRQPVWSTKFTPADAPFRLERKKARHIARPQRQHYITSVESVESRRTVCIETDGPSHLYLAGHSMVPTHNSILRPCFDAWNTKVALKSDFIRYLAQFATPSLIGYTAEKAQPYLLLGSDGQPLIDPATEQPIERKPQEDMVDALIAFMSGSATAFPFGSKVDIAQVTGEGAAYLNALARLDHEMAKAVLNQTLATEEGAHQARAASSTHKDVLDDLVRFVKRPLQRMLRRDVFGTWMRLNGNEADMALRPTVRLGRAASEDVTRLMGAFAALFAAGYLDKSQFPGMDDVMELPKRTPPDSYTASMREQILVKGDEGAVNPRDGATASNRTPAKPAKQQNTPAPNDAVASAGQGKHPPAA